MEIQSSTAQLVDDKKKPSYRNQYIGAFSACMGSLCVGVALGYSSPAGVMMTIELHNGTADDCNCKTQLSESQNSWFESSVNIGAIVGGPIGGILVNAIGRKGSLIFSSSLMFASWMLTAFAVNFAMLICSRIGTGIAAGIVCIGANTYVAEFASVEIRGTLGSGFQLLAVFGFEFAYVCGALIDTWQLLAIACSIPSIITIILMVISRESPLYLLSKGREEDAKKSLQFFRGEHYSVQRELDIMRDSLDEAKKNKTSVKDLFVNSYLLKPFLISLALMFFQQACGVNAVLFNLASIFKDAGTGISEKVSSIIVGFVQIVATATSTFLTDRAGRKALLIGSSSIMAVSLVALGVFFYEQENGRGGSLGWLPLTSLMIFIAAFALGYGPIPWLMMSELFPRAVLAGGAASISTMSNWSMSFIITLIFTPLKGVIGDYGAYWMFAGICFVNFLFCIFIVPETKGKTIEEISSYFGAPSPQMEDPLELKEKGKEFEVSVIS